MSKTLKIFLGIVAVVGVVVGWNVISLQSAIWSAMNDDSRNSGINAVAYYRYGMIPSEIVYDLWDVSGTNSPADVTRLFFEFSERMKERSFDRVILAWHGQPKFVMDGLYFTTIGMSHGTENPVYMVRTLPEHLWKPDGTKAFGTWSGGLLGVLVEQMKDFQSFHDQWYLNELRYR